jgi:PAS domain S-box-containing protein
MKWATFHNLSFKHKVQLYGYAVNCVSLILACVAFMVYDTYSFRNSLVDRISSHANVVGKTCASRLAVRDSEFVIKLLGELEGESRVVAACIYANDGSVFARYVRGKGDYAFPKEPRAIYTDQSQKETLSVFRPILLNGEQLGIIYIKSDLGELGVRFRRYAGIAAGIMLVSFILTRLISRRLLRAVSNSVEELVRAAKAVSDEKDYSQRATQYGKDELGVLTSAFNEMLAQIQERDESLRTSEIKHRTLVENIPQKVFIKNKDSIFVSCNQNLADDLKITQEQIVGKSDFDFFPKELADKYRSDDKRVMESGVTEEIEEKYILNGQDAWVHTIKVPLRDEQGAVTGILGVFQDITERKKVEMELSSKEEFLDRIIEQSPYATWISDAEGTLQRTNPALRRLLNLTDEQLVGKYNVLEDPLVEQQGLLGLIQTVFEDGKTINFPCHWCGEDIPKWNLGGSNSVDIEATMFPVCNQAGELTNVVLHWIDITERKRSEEELREKHNLLCTLIDNIPDYIYVKDAQSRFILNNKAHLELLGVTQQEAAVGKRDLDFFVEKLADGYSADEQDIMRTGKLLINQEEITQRRDGSEQWLLTTKAPLRNSNGDIIGIIGISHDITERKRAGEELEKHREHLEELVSERTADLEKRSDELRHIVNSMAGREKRMVELKEVVKKLREQLEKAGLTPVANDPLKEAVDKARKG